MKISEEFRRLAFQLRRRSKAHHPRKSGKLWEELAGFADRARDLAAEAESEEENERILKRGLR